MDNRNTKKEVEILYEKIKATFPMVLSKKEELFFTLYDFPTSKFKITVSNRIHIQSVQKEHFKYFQNKTAISIEETFPNIRFFWKSQEVFIYLEENGSKVYVTENDMEGFSARFYDIIMLLHDEVMKLSWK